MNVQKYPLIFGAQADIIDKELSGEFAVIDVCRTAATRYEILCVGQE